MKPTFLACGLVGLGLAVAPGLQARYQAPGATFRSAVDLVALEVTVVDREGKPIPTLKVTDFEVLINGRPRKVISADLITYTESKTAPAPAPSAATPVIKPLQPATVSGRVVLLAVDEGSLSHSAARVAMQAAKQFVQSLPPEDVVGVFPFPFGKPVVDLVHNHTEVAFALDKVTGRYSPPRSTCEMTVSEVVDITAGDQDVLATVGARCGEPNLRFVYGDAVSQAAYIETQYMQSLGDLRDLLHDVGSVPGRKIVVLVSGGMVKSDRSGGRPDVSAILKNAAVQAAASNAVLYVLHIDSSFTDAFSAANPSAHGSDPSFRLQSLGRDRAAQALGLEQIAGDSGGTVIRDQAGSGQFGFARILRETSAYYLLGVEPAAADRDGRTHYIRVKANAKNATVRSRTEVVIPRPRL